MIKINEYADKQKVITKAPLSASQQPLMNEWIRVK